jgi:hypothetical protein
MSTTRKHHLYLTRSDAGASLGTDRASFIKSLRLISSLLPPADIFCCSACRPGAPMVSSLLTRDLAVFLGIDQRVRVSLGYRVGYEWRIYHTPCQVWVFQISNTIPSDDGAIPDSFRIATDGVVAGRLEADILRSSLQHRLLVYKVSEVCCGSTRQPALCNMPHCNHRLARDCRATLLKRRTTSTFADPSGLLEGEDDMDAPAPHRHCATVHGATAQSVRSACRRFALLSRVTTIGQTSNCLPFGTVRFMTPCCHHNLRSSLPSLSVPACVCYTYHISSHLHARA